MYKRFQSRATRKVLGKPYSGITSDFNDFLNSNNISQSYSYEYSNYNWQITYISEIDIIPSSPSREDIFSKLSKA